jgi:cytochrome c-type biogenesis protein CcmF
MLGGILVKLAFVICFASVVSYFLNHLGKSDQFLKLGRYFFFITVALVLSIAAYFLSLILAHQFQYTYIWSYSSRELPTPLLISTFYAGQEGSFMLWTLFTAIIGLFLVRHSSRMGYEPQVMSVFGLIELTLLLMLIVKNPFLYVWESWPDQVKAGFLPANGRGLNPLLQNYWMVIHPQVLFSGFASMGVPYAYAVAAMMKRDYANWIRPATPWIVFAGLILGTGIMMGGFWAYETLGWGGYWGWDPVENSSLVPWIFAISSIHMILSQRKSGAFVRTNLILGMLCFLMVLYSTFLTRSGVLGETSVNSFVDPGLWAYWLLVGMMLLFSGIGAFFVISRWKEMPKAPPRHGYYSREFALFLGASVLVLAALLVIAGTSSPIITDLLHGKKSAVETSYYVTTTVPLGILVGLLTGIGQLLWWTRSDRKEFWRNLLLPALLAFLITVVLSFFIAADTRVILFLFGTAFALCTNLQVGWKIVRGNPKYAGGAVAHIGLAVMFFGFVASSEYDEKQTISLTQGKPVEALGYTLTYVGYGPLDNEKYAFHVDVEREGKLFRVSPIMYYSAYNDGLMRNPDILNLIT